MVLFIIFRLVMGQVSVIFIAKSSGFLNCLEPGDSKSRQIDGLRYKTF